MSAVPTRPTECITDGRLNNAGIAGEGSREGYEASEDADKFKAQLWKSEFSEWSDIYQTNVISYYVSFHLLV